MNVAGQGLQIIEELAACAQGPSDGLVELGTKKEYSVEEESEEEQ